MVKIEMRRMAAALHTLLNRHLGECIPAPQSPRVPPGTRPRTLQRQDFFFLMFAGRWAAPKSLKQAHKRPTEHRKPTQQAPTRPRVRGACLAHAHAALGAWEPLGGPDGIKTSRSANGAPPPAPPPLAAPPAATRARVETVLCPLPPPPPPPRPLLTQKVQTGGVKHCAGTKKKKIEPPARRTFGISCRRARRTRGRTARRARRRLAALGRNPDGPAAPGLLHLSRWASTAGGKGVGRCAKGWREARQ